MADTYTSLHYHIIFSTKNRERYIAQEIEPRIWEYIGGIARKNKLTALCVGGVGDHLHTLVMAPPTIAPSQVAQWLKGGSFRWIREEFSQLRSFEWQDGHGAFTVSKSQISEVIQYIQDQRAPHRRKSFQEEYREFLHQHGIEYDERYLWG